MGAPAGFCHWTAALEERVACMLLCARVPSMTLCGHELGALAIKQLRSTEMDDPAEHLIAGICTSSNADAALAKFMLVHEELANVRILFATDKAGGVSLATTSNRQFSEGAAVRSLFPTPGVLVLDCDTVREVQSGPATFPVDHSLSLDTQAVSYLRPFLHGGSNRLPKDIAEVFDFIARPDVDVNPLPYTYENLDNLGDKHNEQEILGILESYQILRTLDVDCLHASGVVRSELSDDDLKQAAAKSLEGMRKRRAEPGFYGGLKFRHGVLYACLLKMAEVQLRRASADVDDKMSEFLDFCDETLCSMPAREIALARLYFEKGTNFHFFGRIQRKRGDVLENLRNMAWDLLHVRQLEEMASFKVSPQARCFLPALLTFDKGLIEVMDNYPLKALAFNCRTGGDVMPFFAGDGSRCFATTAEGRDNAIRKFYSQERCEARAWSCTGTRARMPDIIRALEAAVAKCAGPQTP